MYIIIMGQSEHGQLGNVFRGEKQAPDYIWSEYMETLQVRHIWIREICRHSGLNKAVDKTM